MPRPPRTPTAPYDPEKIIRETSERELAKARAELARRSCDETVAMNHRLAAEALVAQWESRLDTGVVFPEPAFADNGN